MGRLLGTLLCVGMLALAVVGIGNCYSPPSPACGFLCNAANGFACPESYTCSHTAGVCVSNNEPMTRCYADASATSEGPDADRTSPMIDSTVPANGATNVAVDSTITISPNQPLVVPDNTAIQLLDGASSVAIVVGANGSDITITPVAPLAGGHTFTVKLDRLVGAVTMAPLQPSPYTFTFTTIDTEPPSVFSSTPAPNDANVPVTSTVVVTFTEPVQGVDATSFTINATAGTVAANADATVWTFTPTAALPAGTQLTVTLSSAITDRAANHLSPTTFSFTTAD